MAVSENEQAIQRFIAALAARDLSAAMAEFGPDTPAPPDHPKLPLIGVTEHGLGVGPTFYGRHGVQTLLSQLLASFDPVALAPVSGERPLFSADSDGSHGAREIGLRADLIGTFKSAWFQQPAKLYSRPLSKIPVTPGATLAEGQAPGIPTFALFGFSGGKILRLALYMDRFKFVQRLGEEWHGEKAPTAAAV